MKPNFNLLQWSVPAILIFTADQAIKIAVRRMPLNKISWCIPGIIEFTHCTNTGAAFSIMTGRGILIAAISVLLMIALLLVFQRTMYLTAGSRMALSVLLGAGLGNLFDRIVYGGVTDYIRLVCIRFPVFNLADIGITLSVAILIFDLITGRLDHYPEEKTNGSDD